MGSSCQQVFPCPIWGTGGSGFVFQQEPMMFLDLQVKMGIFCKEKTVKTSIIVWESSSNFPKC